MPLNLETAEVILSAIHLAWSAGDVARLMDLITQDVVYCCNLPDETGNSRLLNGRDAFVQFLQSKCQIMQSTTTINQFSYSSGIGRAHVRYIQRHRRTGLEYSGSYRQIATFRGSQVAAFEEFHDVEKLRAFWNLVASEHRL